MSELKCPLCDSTSIETERRPDGYHTCQGCGWRWKMGSNDGLATGGFPKKDPAVLSAAEIQFLKDEFLKAEMKREPILETMQKIHLEPGDDLIVKLRGFDMDEMASLQSLKNMLEEKYPANRVMVFYLPEGCEIDFSVIKKI